MPASSPPQTNAPTTQKWRDFVAASPHGDVLQTLDWGPVKIPEYTPIPVALENAGGGFDASCLVLKKALPLGKCYFYLSRGPILNWSDETIVRAMFDKIVALARAHRAVFIRTDPCVVDGTPGVKELLQRLGFVASPDAGSIFGGLQPRCNMVLDISAPIEDVFEKKFESKWRYNTRLATKKGVEVRASSDRSDLVIFHDIYRTTGERNEFKGYSLGYFEKMWDALVPSGIMQLFLSFHEGEALSGAIAFKLPPHAWYMFGASSNHKRNLMPNHGMQWTMMQWAKTNGCASYDFRGVPDPNLHEIPAHEEGLVKFKTGFGAEMVRYIGEYDLPLDKTGYWAFTQARPKLVATLKKLRR